MSFLKGLYVKIYSCVSKVLIYEREIDKQIDDIICFRFEFKKYFPLELRFKKVQPFLLE